MSSSILLFVASWLVYTCAYVARGNFSFARSSMIDAGTIGVGIAGLISAAYFICYALGQTVNGVLADRCSPFVMVFIGLGAVVISNLAMTLALPGYIYVLLWGINGYAQSMLWSPVFFITSNILNEKLKYRAIALLTLCVPIGKISCGLLSGLALGRGKWQGAFYMAALVVLGVALLWVTASLISKKSVVVRLPEQNEKESGKAKDKENSSKNSGGKLALLVSGGMLMLIAPMIVHGLFYNGVVEVIPSILTSEYGLGASAAAVLDTVIPFVGIGGVFLANLLYKAFRKNEVRCAFFIMLINLLPLGIMLAIALASNARQSSGTYAEAVIFVIAYGLVYVLQLAFNYMIVSLMPMRYAGFAMAATVSGLVNAINYGGSAISTYGMSYAVESLPLHVTVVIWMACVVLACAFLYFAQRKWTSFSAEHKFD